MVNGTNGLLDRLLLRALFIGGSWPGGEGFGYQKARRGYALKGLGVSVLLMGEHYARPIRLPP